LSELHAETIFGKVDCVIHNAAKVSHLKSYPSLRSTNLGSTKELVRLCLPCRVPLHYVSNVGVAIFAIRDTVDEVSVSSMPPPTDGADGYSASKWASERFLEHVNVVFGLPVWIHRPSGITRLADEEQDENELLRSILHFSRKMKVVPETDFIKGALDLVSMENVSRDIVAEMLANKPRSQDGLSYVHHTGDATIPFNEMNKYLEQESGATSVKFEKVPLVEWAERAEKVGLQESLATVLKNVDKLGIAQVNIPRFIKTIS
jgi:hybrid polyketide synthase/nonribosomal peptide synthetase ACE1